MEMISTTATMFFIACCLDGEAQQIGASSIAHPYYPQHLFC
jgi:hypothetical protein